MRDQGLKEGESVFTPAYILVAFLGRLLDGPGDLLFLPLDAVDLPLELVALLADLLAPFLNMGVTRSVGT